jgi:hypothetical protein
MDIALAVILAASASLNVVQSREIEKLRTSVPSGTADWFAGLTAQTVDGRSVRIQPAQHGQATLLYVFTPQCGWCSRNQESLAALAAGTRSSHRLVALSLTADGGRDGLPPDFEVYVNPSPEAVVLYDLTATPTTLVVSPEGRILRTWRGAYVGGLKAEIEKFFSVNLPAASGGG